MPYLAQVEHVRGDACCCLLLLLLQLLLRLRCLLFGPRRWSGVDICLDVHVQGSNGLVELSLDPFFFLLCSPMALFSFSLNASSCASIPSKKI